MKKIIIFLILIATVSVAFAEEETLLNAEDLTYKGFFTGILKGTEINDHGAAIIGGRGGVVINKHLALGAGLYWLVNEVEGNLQYKDEDIEMYYGGFWIEYIFMSDKLYHVSLGTTLGLGEISFDEDCYYDCRDDCRDDYHCYDCRHDCYDDCYDVCDDDDDGFFVVEPEINIILNLTNSVRLGTGVSYRLVDGINTDGLSDSDMGGFSGHIYVKVGF